MPAPIKPNTEAARAALAIARRQRKIDAAKRVLWELDEPVLTASDVAEMLTEPDYRRDGLSSHWLRGYFKLPESME